MEVSQPMDMITHAVIGGGKTIDFGISNSAEFFDILSRTLYTDQILAVVREVLCNAWDAHIAAGCTDKPIQIRLGEEFFEVRDFGPGIHHNEIGPIYGVYGASTKKQDGAQTGGFGLGCKAPFAYTDHFEVASAHMGTRTIYNMSKSNAAAKGKPGIITLAQIPTHESGLQVKIPIQGKDYQRFHELVKRIIANGEMLATLNGDPVPVIKFSEATNGFLLTTQPIMEDSNTKRLLLRYGNVIYPVESCKEIEVLYTRVGSFLQRLNDHNIFFRLVLQAEPDTISVTPSREALSMQEHTINTINKLLKNFLNHVKDLDAEMLEQAGVMTETSIVQKNYQAIFSESWGFKEEGIKFSQNIMDVQSIAKFMLTRRYPNNVQFRVNDVKHRITKAMEVKVLDQKLASTFLQELPKVKDIPTRYSRLGKAKSSDWLHRRVIGKVVAKLRNSGLDDSGLFLIDKNDPGNVNIAIGNRLVPFKLSYGRNHLANLPFLRKIVVITSAVTMVNDRLRYAQKHDPKIPQDGMLCYYVRSRKAGKVDEAIEFFKKMRYEIVDLTKRQLWERVSNELPLPRKKPDLYVGLPAIGNILVNNKQISVGHYRNSTDDPVMLPSPELAIVISLRNSYDNMIDGYTTKATRNIIKLYGQRLGIARDKIELKKAIKHGALEFQPVLEQEMITMLTNSPTIKEYFAYEHLRVRDTTRVYETDLEALALIYRDPDLRKEFGLIDNMTDDERTMVNISHQMSCISTNTSNTIRDFKETIPLNPINKKVLKLTSKENEMLKIIDISAIRAGLLGPKRSFYLDIFLKVIKG